MRPFVRTLPIFKRPGPGDDLERVPRRPATATSAPAPDAGAAAAPPSPTAPASPAGSVSRARRSRGTVDVPLGSLTQASHRHNQVCRTCGSDRVTRLAMELTDGTPVEFLSCHVCECRVWERDGDVLDIGTVLDHTRRTA